LLIWLKILKLGLEKSQNHINAVIERFFEKFLGLIKLSKLPAIKNQRP
jgi:hypothetical protein